MDSTNRVSNDGWKGALQLRDRSYVAIKLPVGEGTAAMAGAFTIESWFRLRVRCHGCEVLLPQCYRRKFMFSNVGI